MATIKLRLCDADRERFGGPEWTTYDDESFLHLDYDAQYALEKDMLEADRLTLVRLVLIEWPRRSVLGIRGMLWMTRQLAGVTEPKWAEFKPNPLLADVERVGGDDEVPPEHGSSQPPSEETPDP